MYSHLLCGQISGTEVEVTHLQNFSIFLVPVIVVVRGYSLVLLEVAVAVALAVANCVRKSWRFFNQMNCLTE